MSGIGTSPSNLNPVLKYLPKVLLKSLDASRTDRDIDLDGLA